MNLTTSQKLLPRRRLPLLSAAGCTLVLGLFVSGCDESPELRPSSPSSGLHQPLMDQLDEYEARMTSLIALLRESDDAAAIEEGARGLVEHSLPILDRFVDVHPDCREYLEASKGVVDAMERLSAEQIETDYHLDGALPEGSSTCYHAKDLLVHPATVIVLLREGGLEEHREQMVHEIVENQAHLNAVRASIEETN